MAGKSAQERTVSWCALVHGAWHTVHGAQRMVHNVQAGMSLRWPKPDLGAPQFPPISENASPAASPPLNTPCQRTLTSLLPPATPLAIASARIPNLRMTVVSLPIFSSRICAHEQKVGRGRFKKRIESVLQGLIKYSLHSSTRANPCPAMLPWGCR